MLVELKRKDGLMPLVHGVLVFHHESSDRYYVARTSILRHLYNKIFQLLRNNKLENKEFQKAFNNDNKLEVYYSETTSLEDSIQLQQSILMMFEGKLFNVSNATGNQLGIKTTFKIIAPPEPIILNSTTFYSKLIRVFDKTCPSNVLPALMMVYKDTSDNNHYGIANTISLINCSKIPSKQNGVYCIWSKATKKLYIGSSHVLNLRILQHISHCKSHTHRNRNLQSIFDNHGLQDFEVMFVAFVELLSVDLLREIEQELITSAIELGFDLLNISKDAAVFGNGLVKNERAKLKIGYCQSRPIMCEGRRYDSLKDAASDFNCSVSQIWKRLNSKSTTDLEFFYLTTGKNHLAKV